MARNRNIDGWIDKLEHEVLGRNGGDPAPQLPTPGAAKALARLAADFAGDAGAAAMARALAEGPNPDFDAWGDDALDAFIDAAERLSNPAVWRDSIE